MAALCKTERIRRKNPEKTAAKRKRNSVGSPQYVFFLSTKQIKLPLFVFLGLCGNRFLVVAPCFFNLFSLTLNKNSICKYSTRRCNSCKRCCHNRLKRYLIFEQLSDSRKLLKKIISPLWKIKVDVFGHEILTVGVVILFFNRQSTSIFWDTCGSHPTYRLRAPAAPLRRHSPRALVHYETFRIRWN